MASVQKSVLVPYSATRMFELVEHVEDYPLFLPWCAGAKTLERRTGEALVRIDINYHGVRAHFTTANRSRPPELIVIDVKVGIPREVKNNEFRVAITPAGVHELVRHGHEVVIEKDAGLGSSITNNVSRDWNFRFKLRTYDAGFVARLTLASWPTWITGWLRSSMSTK